MEKLLLTVREAADVLSVSRSRVYGLICAEQLDSVKIGRSRRVSLASSSGISSGCVTWPLQKQPIRILRQQRS
jgi:excisionase family DNA binding protein